MLLRHHVPLAHARSRPPLDPPGCPSGLGLRTVHGRRRDCVLGACGQRGRGEQGVPGQGRHHGRRLGRSPSAASVRPFLRAVLALMLAHAHSVRVSPATLLKAHVARLESPGSRPCLPRVFGSSRAPCWIAVGGESASAPQSDFVDTVACGSGGEASHHCPRRGRSMSRSSVIAPTWLCAQPRCFTGCCSSRLPKLACLIIARVRDGFREIRLSSLVPDCCEKMLGRQMRLAHQCALFHETKLVSQESPLAIRGGGILSSLRCRCPDRHQACHLRGVAEGQLVHHLDIAAHQGASAAHDGSHREGVEIRSC